MKEADGNDLSDAKGIEVRPQTKQMTTTTNTFSESENSNRKIESRVRKKTCFFYKKSELELMEKTNCCFAFPLKNCSVIVAVFAPPNK